MSKLSLILIVALQVGMAGAALAASHKQNTPPAMSSEAQALIDRVGPAPGGEP